MTQKAKIVVQNERQKILFEDELSGQISDGFWENTPPHDHWIVPCNAEISVATESEPFGINFEPDVEYDFSDCDLVDIVGDRMIENIKEKTGIEKYDLTELTDDLDGINLVFSTQL